jgi:hypothetical protein
MAEERWESHTSVATSTNSGATWAESLSLDTEIDVPEPVEWWLSVASSSDGTTLAAMSMREILVSTDSGVTWTPIGALAVSWSKIALSADGTKLVAATSPGSSQGSIYTLQLPVPPSAPAPPSVPKLSISRDGQSLGLSWLIPSTRCVLQQNSDLTAGNWTDVPASPDLNFVNLHHEVNVSPSLGPVYFRLKQQ